MSPEELQRIAEEERVRCDAREQWATERIGRSLGQTLRVVLWLAAAAGIAVLIYAYTLPTGP